MSDCRQPLVLWDGHGMSFGCRLDVMGGIETLPAAAFQESGQSTGCAPSRGRLMFWIGLKEAAQVLHCFSKFNGLLPSLVISSYQVGQPNDDYLQHLHEELLKEKQDPMWDEDVGFIATHVRALQEKVFAEFQQKRQEHAQLKLLGSQSSDGPQLSPPVVPSFSMFCTVACEAWDAKEAGHSFDMFFQHLYTCSDW